MSTTPIPEARAAPRCSTRRDANTRPSRHSAVRAALRTRPLIAFFALSYAVSWCLVPLGVFLPFGPAVAALIVLSAVDGKPGRRALRDRVLRRPTRRRWYAIAIVLPLAIALSAIWLNVAAGAPAAAVDGLDPWYLLALGFVVRLVNPLDGPLGEEPGWRGFALPRLQATRSPLRATLILSVLVAGWHVPLVFLPSEHLAPVLLLGTIAVTFIYTWLFNRTGGSVLTTLLAHAAEGTIRLATLGFVPTDATRLYTFYTAALCLVAAGLIVCDRRSWQRPATSAPTRATRALPSRSGGDGRRSRPSHGAALTTD